MHSFTQLLPTSRLPALPLVVATVLAMALVISARPALAVSWRAAKSGSEWLIPTPVELRPGRARAGRRGRAGQVGRRQQRGQPVSVDSLGGIYQGHVLGGRVHGRVWAVVARVDIEPAGRRDFARRTPDGARPEPPSSLLVGHQVVTSRGGASSEPKAQACPSGSSMPSTRGGRRSSSSEATRRAMTDSMRNTSPWPTLSMKSILNN